MCAGRINANLIFDHICVMNSPSNGAVANTFTSDYIQPVENIRAIITMCINSFEQNLAIGGCNGGVITSLDTELLHNAQQNPSINRILQSVTVTAENASHMMNTFTEHDSRISYNVEHDSYQDMHFWHLFSLCISLHGAENFQIHVWKVNSTRNMVKSFTMNNQNLLAHSSDKARFQFPVYIRRHNISCGYLSCSFFIRKVRYSSLIDS